MRASHMSVCVCESCGSLRPLESKGWITMAIQQYGKGIIMMYREGGGKKNKSRLEKRPLWPSHTQACLIASHGQFCCVSVEWFIVCQKKKKTFFEKMKKCRVSRRDRQPEMSKRLCCTFPRLGPRVLTCAHAARGAALWAGGVTTCKQLAGIVDNGNTLANSTSAQTALGVISGNLTWLIPPRSLCSNRRCKDENSRRRTDTLSLFSLFLFCCFFYPRTPVKKPPMN